MFVDGTTNCPPLFSLNPKVVGGGRHREKGGGVAPQARSDRWCCFGGLWQKGVREGHKRSTGHPHVGLGAEHHVGCSMGASCLLVIYLSYFFPEKRDN